MAFDGGFLHCLIKELKAAEGTKVDKIYQPARDELVFVLRSKEFNGRLFASASPSSARLHFTKQSIENPAQPPMFCMLMRKHLVGARLTEISQNGLDRTAVLEFEGINELGDITHPKVVVELIGRQANIILTDTNGKIIDAVRRSDIEKGGRLIQPGATYTLPEGQGKLSPLAHSSEYIAEKIDSLETSPDKAYLSVVEGLSPLISRELAALDGSTQENIEGLKDVLISGGEPCVITDKNGAVVEYSYMPLKQYGTAVDLEVYESYSVLLDRIYGKRDAKNRIAQSAKEISKLLSSSHSRILRKLENRRAELEKCAKREQYRVWGELLKANLHLIEAGAESVRVKNYYDPEMNEVNIPLNGALSGSANAAAYFKEYKKLCNAERLLGQLIADGERELLYIESVTEALERAESMNDISEILTELEATGYIHRRGKQTHRQSTSAPKEYTSPDGFKILAGRNNIQNDRLTFKIAAKDDIWLHVKDFPGAHVIIVASGKAIPHSTVLFAANIAAANTSKTKQSSSVPVDYTLVKRVKKQPGGKPGMVTYTEQKTLYVTPDTDVI